MIVRDGAFPKYLELGPGLKAIKSSTVFTLEVKQPECKLAHRSH